MISAHGIDFSKESSVSQGDAVRAIGFDPVLSMWEFSDDCPSAIPSIWVVAALILYGYAIIFFQLRKLLCVLVVRFDACQVSLSHRFLPFVGGDSPLLSNVHALLKCGHTIVQVAPIENLCWRYVESLDGCVSVLQ